MQKGGTRLLQFKKQKYTYNDKYKSAITVGKHMKIYRSNCDLRIIQKQILTLLFP